MADASISPTVVGLRVAVSIRASIAGLKPLRYPCPMTRSVWHDLCNTPEEAAAMEQRSLLLMQLADFAQRASSAAHAAEVLQVPVETVNAMLAGKLSRFELDELQMLASRLETYPVNLTPDEDGGFIARARDVPGMIAQGEDVQDALYQAADALAAALDGLPAPAPSPQQPGEYLVKPAFHA